MQHMEKVRAAAHATTLLTGDPEGTWDVVWEPGEGYTVKIRWTPGATGEALGMCLTISEDRAEHDPELSEYLLGVVGDISRRPSCK